MAKNLPYKRTDRVADNMFQILSEAFVMDISDPRLAHVSLTRVRMTDDLKIARIYFYAENMTEDAKRVAIAGLTSAKGFLKKKIAKSMDLKFTPELEFYYDDSIDLFAKIENLSNL